MQYSNESLDRQKKIQDLKNAGVICYANHFHGKQDITNIIQKQDQAKEGKSLMETGASGDFRTAGRLILHRSMGKLVFSKIIDHSGEIQLCFQRDKVIFNTGNPTFCHPGPRSGVSEKWDPERDPETSSGWQLVNSLTIDGEEKTAHKIAEKYCQMGDYIGVVGDLFFTKHGELTLFVKEFQILSKAVRPLPEKFHGVSDQETLYRKRYLDMISNEETYNRMKLRSKFLKVLRDFYHENEFIEIETPVLGNSASGAAAKPFITHHNDYDEDMFLRISPETNLKKATVWRFERVVEFAKDFRNEGSDPSHMQEFTMIEHYAAWWNFEDNMDFTEKMFAFIFDAIPELNPCIKVKDKKWVEKQVDFSKKWERIDYIEWVKKACWIDVSKYDAKGEKELREKIKSAGYSWEGIDKQATATLIDYLYKKVLRPNITGPAFVYNYPKTMQPLARANDANPDIVEQFQVVVNGWEIIKAYSELVDPKLQAENFDAQSDALERWDEEATSPDDDFVLAMEYAMPPQSGWGMWIDRVFSLLTEQENLRDVVLFPLMKSQKNGEQ